MAIELPKRVAENIDRFTGRAWLLPMLIEWWDKGDDQIFLLTGGPGTGKSMIMAWLAGFGPEPQDALAKEQLGQLRQAVKAVHFCQAASRNITPQAFAQNIANQLTGTVKGFGDALADTLAERVQITPTQTIGAIATGGTATNLAIGRIDLSTLGDELSFDRAFTQPLKTLYEKGRREPMLLLVDALDEADTYTGVKIPDLLSRLSDLPTPIRILATTRDEPEVLKFCRSIKPFDLVKDADSDVDDVRTYAARRLTQLTTVAQPDRDEFAERLVQQAQGVFLYAAMVLDELLNRPPSELPDLRAYLLPTGLGGIYHEYLIRVLGKDLQRWFELYEPMLGLIAVAQGEGLTAKQLTDIIGRDIRAALLACKQYLSGELPDGPFRLFHKSFADFLLEEKDNVDYHIDAEMMHRKIAEHYWNSFQDDWQRCDNYALNNLATHLFEGHDIEHLQALINENWIHARYAQGSYTYDGFLVDVELARWAAEEVDEEQTQANRQAPYLTEEVRCALCFASINSLASHIPLSCFATFVKKGIWTPLRGLIYARRVPESKARYTTLISLALDLPETLMAEAISDALVAAKQISNGEQRAWALTKLLPALPDTLRTEALIKTMEAVRQLKDTTTYDPQPWNRGHYGNKALKTIYTGNRNKALWELAEVLLDLAEVSAASLVKQLRGACDIDDETACMQILTKLASNLKASPHKALPTALAVNHGPRRAEVLALLPPDEVLLHETVDMARHAVSGEEKFTILASLAPYLPKEMLQEALASVWEINRDDVRRQALSTLAPYLPEALLSEALTVTQETGGSEDKADIVGALAPHLPEGLLPAALAVAGGIDKDDVRTRALLSLAPQLPDELLPEALAIACGINRDDVHSIPEVLQKALVASMRIGDDDDRAWALVGLAPYLPEKLWSDATEEALKAAQKIESEPGRAEALAHLAPHLAGSLLPEALAATRKLSPYHRLEPLSALVSRLPESILPEALAATREINLIEWSNDKAKALAALAPYLPKAVFHEALAITRELGESDWRPLEAQAQALVSVAPYLPKELLPEALAAAGKMPGILAVQVLTALIPYIVDSLQTEALRDALAATKQIRDDEQRAQALTKLLPYLHGALLPEAFAIAQGLDDEGARVQALIALAPYLPEILLPEVLATVQEIEGGDSKAKALIGLASCIPEPLLHRALTMATDLLAVTKSSRHGGVLSSSHDQLSAAQVLTALVPHLSESLLHEALAIVRGYDDEGARVQALIALTPYLPEALLPEALSTAKEIASDSARAAVLTQVASRLPELLRAEGLLEAFEAAKKISGPFGWSTWDKVTALVRLAPQLPEQQRTEAQMEALAVAKITFGSKNEREALETLVDLACQSPEPLKNEVFDWIVTIAKNATQPRGYRACNAFARIGLLLMLLHHLPEPQQTEAVSSVLSMIREDFVDYVSYESYQREEHMAALAPYLSKQLLLDAEIADTEGTLPSHLPTVLLPDALAIAKRQKNKKWLFALTPRLPEPLLPEALEAAKEIGGDSLQAELMAKFADAFARLAPTELYLAWRDTLRGMANLDRRTFLRDLRTLPPVIASLGGQKAIEGVLRGIHDVGCWWP